MLTIKRAFYFHSLHNFLLKRLLIVACFLVLEMIKNGTDDPACVITIQHTISQDTDGRRATNKILLEYMQTQFKLTDDIMTR